MMTERGSGRTTQQLLAAPRRAVFVWCERQLIYPRHLAAALGRKDLQIVSPDWLLRQTWRGGELFGVVIDHATTLTQEHLARLSEVEARIRRSRRTPHE